VQWSEVVRLVLSLRERDEAARPLPKAHSAFGLSQLNEAGLRPSKRTVGALNILLS